jgi:putative ATP-dependent endonuclease of OLD family
MAKLESITIQNYRSIGENSVTINFPENTPIILIGENNSGKTNIIRAIDILFGEWHPKYKEFEDHDYFERNPTQTIKIIAKVSEFQSRLGRNKEYECVGFELSAQKGQPNNFVAIQDNEEENQYVSNDIRDELSAVLISSEQNLEYQLSYSTKRTLLSKVTKAFHDRLTSDDDKIERLKKLYEQVLNIFDEVEEFKDFKDKMSSITGELIQNMTHGLKLDFSAYDPSNYYKNLRVLPYEDLGDNQEPRNFEELGTGQQQILALSFAHAYAKCFKNENGLILIIDEPEAHLHPLAQKWLARTLYKMSQDGLQIVITTHSPYFIDLEFLEGIYFVKKGDGATSITNINRNDFAQFCKEHGADKAEAGSIIPFYVKSATTNILKGFFAKKLVLVEGQTEELALPIYLEKVGLDVLKDGIDIIGVGGKGELAKWWRLFTAYKIPCYVCFDNDAEDDDKKSKRRDFLKTIGLEDAEQEDILQTEEWLINDKYCVFGKDFEDTLRKSFSKYKEIEDVIKTELGDSKPLIAREVAKNLCDDNYDEDDNGWGNFMKLANKIRQR